MEANITVKYLWYIMVSQKSQYLKLHIVHLKILLANL